MNIDTTYTTDKYSAWTNTCTFVMLHHTASMVNDENIVSYLAYNPAQVSCHYVIWRNWKIYQIADDNKITRHAWKGQYMWITEMNAHAIWIEVHSDGYDFTDAQRNSVRELLQFLLWKYNLPVEAVIRHKDYTNRKRDIGDNFWNAQYIKFTDYTKSLQKKNISLKEKRIAQKVLEYNSKLRDETDDPTLKNKLHDTSNYIRWYYFNY